MKVFYGLKDLPKLKKSIVSVGTFDGVHTAHQVILKQLLASKLASTVITFWPNPKEYLHSDIKFCYLNTLQEKINLFAKSGLENLIILNFNESIRSLEYKDFVEDILIKKLNMREIVAGFDFHFGKDRHGNIAVLKELGKEKDFLVSFLLEQKIDNLIPRSGNIRNFLLAGETAKANKLLGYNYFLQGQFIFENGNFFEVAKEKLIPKIKTPHKVKIFSLDGDLEAVSQVFEGDLEISQVIPQQNGKKVLFQKTPEIQGNIRIEFVSEG